MKIIYKCHKCQKIIETLEDISINEESLGLNVLTEEEKGDIIKIEDNVMYIDLTCEECNQEYDWLQLIHSQQIH
ncbi:anti-sigma-F factor Fin [Orenia marismortui]|uniref:anti-sigma-F factor Fin n=1 Tax=Orenia marismortui TaxID=46469 RepID=UPI00036F2A5D|nr:anti-sigma-F factor Fin [Orenia marismortui]